MLKLFFSRKWWWTTLLVLAAIGVMARLGFWQIERHTQRAEFNARVTEQINAAPLALTPDLLATDLTKMEYRMVSVTGTYDHSQQIALRNQVWQENKLGVNLLTPLVIRGTEHAILVNRGWIPQNKSAPENWKEFDEPGLVTVLGNLRVSQVKPDFGGVPDPEGALKLWNLVNLTRIAQQMPMPLVPVYVQQIPEPARLVAGSAIGAQTQMPFRVKPEVDLSEGSHLGYAGQWFIFALILAIGYPYFIRKQSQKPAALVGTRTNADGRG